MTDVFIYLSASLLFGLAAGFAPGPLLTLVISETIQYNQKAGIKVALSPLITDVPIILVSIFIINILTSFNWIISIIALAGSIYLFYLAYESFKLKGIDTANEGSTSKSLKKGIIANFLNPHPYIFWITIGAPILIKAFNINIWLAILFVIGMYSCLVGAKLLTAFLVERTKIFLTSKAYIIINYILGGVLVFFAIALIYEAVERYGLL